MRAVLAAVLVLAACKGRGAPPAFEVAVSLEADDLVIAAHHLDDGATITVGERTARAARGDAAIRIPIGDVLHKLTIRQAIGADEIDFRLAITATLPGHEPATKPVPMLRLGTELVTRLAAVTRGPVVFAAEAPPAPRHTALFAEWSDNIVFGPAKLLEDIDWIAVPSDTALTIYERRTGKIVEQKAFPAAPDRNVMKAWLAERVASD